MNNILFATHNRNKAKEISALIGDKYKIVTLDDLNIVDDIEENADTLEGNALIKARYLYTKYETPCFADDTGLEVEELGGAPGVHTARYAGEECIPENNMQKLLSELKNKDNRSARFRTIIAYIDKRGEHLFEGIVDGTISKEKKGIEGFGYDPIFIPLEGDGKTFAQMGLKDKNMISHRARAISKFVAYLNA